QALLAGRPGDGLAAGRRAGPRLGRLGAELVGELEPAFLGGGQAGLGRGQRLGDAGQGHVVVAGGGEVGQEPVPLGGSLFHLGFGQPDEAPQRAGGAPLLLRRCRPLSGGRRRGAADGGRGPRRGRTGRGRLGPAPAGFLVLGVAAGGEGRAAPAVEARRLRG